MHPPHPAASQNNIVASSSSLVSHGSDASVNSISQHIRLTGKLWDRRLRGNLPLILIVNSFIKVVPLYDTTEAAFFFIFHFVIFFISGLASVARRYRISVSLCRTQRGNTSQIHIKAVAGVPSYTLMLEDDGNKVSVLNRRFLSLRPPTRQSHLEAFSGVETCDRC